VSRFLVFKIWSPWPTHMKSLLNSMSDEATLGARVWQPSLSQHLAGGRIQRCNSQPATSSVAILQMQVVDHRIYPLVVHDDALDHLQKASEMHTVRITSCFIYESTRVWNFLFLGNEQLPYFFVKLLKKSTRFSLTIFTYVLFRFSYTTHETALYSMRTRIIINIGRNKKTFLIIRI
jgi:hypothetical protein